MNQKTIIFRCNMGCAFDQAVQGGSVGFVVWETAKAVKELDPDLEVNVVLPLSDQLQALKQNFNVIRKNEFDFKYKVPLTLNKDTWEKDKFPTQLEIETEVYQIRVDGVGIFLFSNAFANSCSKTLYPFFNTRGKEISFYKQVLYQTDCYHFIKDYCPSSLKVVHAHDINNGYLLSALLNPIPNVKTMVSIIDSKMFEQAVYEPLINDLLINYGIEPDIEKNTRAGGLPELITYGGGIPEYSTGEYLFKNYLLPQHLVYRYADIVTADSEGHFEFITSYADCELGRFYQDELKERVNKLVNENRFRPVFLGMYKEWFEVYEKLKGTKVERFEGLTFFHNARFDPFHKGQFELFEAIKILLEKQKNIKFILSLVVFTPEILDELQSIKDKYPQNIEIIGDVLIGRKKMSKQDLALLMKQSDFTIAPSKNSLESFNFAIGEAMLFGNIPLISDQLPLKHWLQDFKADVRQELSLPNVYGNEERNQYLIKAIVEKITHISATYTREKIAALKEISHKTALKYKLQNTAEHYYQIYSEFKKADQTVKV